MPKDRTDVITDDWYIGKDKSMGMIKIQQIDNELRFWKTNQIMIVF